MNKALIIFIIFIVLAGVWIGLRFIIGGSEDTWICVDNEWVKHGVPSAPMPIELCGEKSQAEKSVKLYYYNSDLDKDEFGNTACSRNGLVSIERKIPLTKTPIQDTIKLLLSGDITNKERSMGINTEYPLEGFSLKGALLKDEILTLEFDDLNNKTSGGSCRAGILWFQIEATAKQFSEVKQVRFLPEELFQP
ncbi:MAG: GerMN domain-containing protein [Patescibacteria group bacterium]